MENNFNNGYNFICNKVWENKSKGFLYRHIYSLPYKFLKGFIKSYLKYIRYVLFNTVKYNKCNNFADVIASLTTYPKRINTVHLTIKTILNQDNPPKKVVIWLATEEFPDGISSLPMSLKKLLKYNVEIRFVEENLKSHKKYIYAFKHFPNDTIITFDDDVFYRPDTIRKLLFLYKNNPQSICANIVHKIIYTDNFSSYKKWPRVYSSEIINSKENIAIGFGGILYPARIFGEELFDSQGIRDNCLHADDLWLKACSLLKNIKVASGGDFFATPITIPKSQQVGLKQLNITENQNDIQWKNICKYLNISPKAIKV